jgi:hypothetical protein
MGAARERAAGFTVIEVLGAVFLALVVLTLVSGIFSENGRQRAVASERLRTETAAATALDRIAEDLEATILMSRPAGGDPRDHPWRFVAEDPGELGARALRFQTQNVSRANLAEHASTRVDVAYYLTEEETDETGGEPRFTLWRWQSLRPPSEPTLRWPEPEDPGSARLAEGLADFGVRLVDAEGGVVDEWDSTFAVDDAPLPLGAEISVVLYRTARDGEAEPGVLEVPGDVHERSISLAMPRPIDLSALIALAAGDGEAECGTIADCADFDDTWFVELRESGCDGDEELCELLNASTEVCWSEVAREWPSVAAAAAPECGALP